VKAGPYRELSAESYQALRRHWLVVHEWTDSALRFYDRLTPTPDPAATRELERVQRKTGMDYWQVLREAHGRYGETGVSFETAFGFDLLPPGPDLD
jgi:hypothetical protein